ncbi:YciI family protein [Xanthomonas maliensis]|uniref:YciI family protein n=1 Tax=Xanthomonas maliensis TaxID=1321368 RepID=UPI00307BA5CF
MALIKATAASESGRLPSERLLTAMGDFNAEMVAAGVLLGGEGLRPSAHGLRLRLDAAGSQLTAGPFAPDGELIAGYWLLQVDTLEDAVGWLQRMPNPDGEQIDIELRPVYEAADFGAAFTEQARAQEAALRHTLGG